MNDGLTGENTQYSRGLEIGNDTKKENIFEMDIMVKPSIRITELIFLCKQRLTIQFCNRCTQHWSVGFL